jgi:hypothetical protein
MNEYEYEEAIRELRQFEEFVDYVSRPIGGLRGAADIMMQCAQSYANCPDGAYDATICYAVARAMRSGADREDAR